MFENMHRLHPRGAANRGVCVDADGAMLGPDWSLVERTPRGYRVAPRDAARNVQKILVVDRGEPDWLYAQGQHIATALNRGEIALAQIYGLRMTIGNIDQQQLKRLAAIATLAKAGFNPDEPRIPGGQSGGGEWTDGASGTDKSPDLAGPGSETPERLAVLQTPAGADAGNDKSSDDSAALQAQLIQAGYRLPPSMWVVIRQLFQQFMAHGGDISALIQYLQDHGLQLDELPAVIQSLFDGPKPLAELQTDKPPAGFQNWTQLLAYLGDPPPGYEWHHIIEQNGQTQPDLTSPDGIRDWIQNTSNVVTIPVIKHYCINSFMSRATPPDSGIPLRNTVRTLSPETQRQIGLNLLRLCGVLQ